MLRENLLPKFSKISDRHLPLEHFLVALDCSADSLKSIRYVNRVLRGSEHTWLTLFHVIPTTSPNLLTREEVHRIEHLQREQPQLSGYFWTTEDEEQMNRTFMNARQLLVESGFPEEHITTRFSVQSTEVAQIILREARDLECSTIILGRRRLSRVKELLLGSVSGAVVKHARGLTVWVVDDSG
jgi:nucleotide-binding universal stress UspA family protein